MYRNFKDILKKKKKKHLEKIRRMEISGYNDGVKKKDLRKIFVNLSSCQGKMEEGEGIIEGGFETMPRKFFEEPQFFSE